MVWQIEEPELWKGFWQMRNQYAASHTRYASKTKPIKRLRKPFLGFCYELIMYDERDGKDMH
jgi:hypothetical protein